VGRKDRRVRSEVEGESEVEGPMEGEEGIEVDGELGSLGLWE
jgi:hypothetical protein